MSNGSRFTAEEGDRLRYGLYTQFIGQIREIAKKVSPDDAITMIQPNPGDPVEVMVVERNALADIYSNMGYEVPAMHLRNEPRVVGMHILVIQAYDGAKLMMLTPVDGAKA